MRKIDLIVVHCAATRPSQNITIDDIARWHAERGFNGVGYHYLIRRDGTVQKGRQDNMAGAHVAGYNANTIGICMAGGINNNMQPEANYTKAQWAALAALVDKVRRAYGVPLDRILGHCDMPRNQGVPLSMIASQGAYPRVQKACPCFDVRKWVHETLGGS